MPKSTAEFAIQVWKASAEVGMSPPRIADHIISDLFPGTFCAADEEGAMKMFRDGCIVSVKRVLHSANDERQGDFGDIADEFKHLVRSLGRTTYHVEQMGEEVAVARLIAEPHLLNDARRFMRKKGEECIAEAKRLDDLYEAVTHQLVLS